MNSLRTPVQMFMLLFGAVYFLVGIAGFIGPFVQEAEAGGEGLLFGLFAVDTEHNIVHIGAGIIAMAAAFTVASAVWMARLFAVVFGILALWGIALVGLVGDETAMMAGLLHTNAADNWLHVGTTALFALFGFVPWMWEQRVAAPGDGRARGSSGAYRT